MPWQVAQKTTKQKLPRFCSGARLVVNTLVCTSRNGELRISKLFPSLRNSLLQSCSKLCGGGITNLLVARQHTICWYTLQHTATHCNTLQHTATHCNTRLHTATHCNTLQHTITHCDTLQHTATRHNTLQHSATHCNTLYHTIRHCNTL